ncbi:hypothetical protein C8R44DRAFT_881205 [Mycena epipterygia]|nr:hypothetical protein C8R44DRAFT_881205 [Mycena epipterygia]
MNFSVRLFEHAPSPGGNWFYTEVTPVWESYPDKLIFPSDKAEDAENIPQDLPATRYQSEGADGIALDERWAPATGLVITELPSVKYSAAIPWSVSVHDVQRHVRAYASMHGLNANDAPISPSSPEIVSYATRVEC